MKAICYHWVRPEGWNDDRFQGHYLPLEDFKRQLDWLARRRWEYLLTFDDGLKDHVRFVMPELDKRGLTGLFFIPTRPFESADLLGVHAAKHYSTGARGDVYLNRADVRALVKAGHVVGSHTVSHPRLPELSRDEQCAELDRSKRLLQEITGEPVDLLAYPFGKFSDSSMEVARELGYRAAFTTQSRDLCPLDWVLRPLRLPRFDCNEFPFGTNKRGA